MLSQAKSNLIRQREVEQLVPAAGPGASDLLHLLRPLAALAFQPECTTDAPHVHKSAKIAETKQEQLLLGRLPAAATARGGGVSATLIGMSCVIGAGGEVCSLPVL